MAKYVSEEIFNLIVSNTLTFIAKLNAGFWAELKEGDSLFLTDGKREIQVQIDSLSYFNNFGDAWFTHNEKLIPSSLANIVTVGDAIKYYRQQYTHEDAIAVGVIAFGFHVQGEVKTL